MSSFWVIVLFLLFTPRTYCFKEKHGYVRIDLHRQKSIRHLLLENPDLIDRIGLNEWLSKPGPPRTNDSINLYRYLDNEFYGKIVIGQPGQTLNVAFDTAWTLSWVLSSGCQKYITPGCWFHNLYDHTKSSFYRKDGQPYIGKEGNYNLTGFYSYENISIAHSNVTAFRFIEITDVPWMYFFNKADGVLGLGVKQPTDEYIPFFYALHDQKKINRLLFSIYLNRDRQSAQGGNVILGFVDKKHVHHVKYPNGSIIYDEIKYLPIDPTQYWQFSMDRILVSTSKNVINMTLCAEGCKAISDTSSTRIIGPEDEIAKIHNFIKAQRFFLGDIWTVTCSTVNKLPKIDFVLGGQHFRLKGPDYIVRATFSSMEICISAFGPNNVPTEENLWVLGGAFLSEFYSIYDIENKQIGFVKAF
uniref:Cathepsin D2 n=1 Tax=Zabrotes subfasciatus TaxID=122865 RepID=A0A8K1XCT3_ZABSU|nr:cathepsin D2 [Zabrotes subfasciatus]